MYYREKNELANASYPSPSQNTFLLGALIFSFCKIIVMTLKTLYYSGIRFANFELNAAKEKLEIVKSRGGAAPLKTAKEPGEKHRLEPYLNFGGENFLII